MVGLKVRVGPGTGQDSSGRPSGAKAFEWGSAKPSHAVGRGIPTAPLGAGPRAGAPI
jgi:hypothetical protein